tara:strand:- start:530 stop:1651 length:1122 start_codon:yes stop_codon:yes gene_type:complete
MGNSKEKFKEVFIAVLGITPQVLTECLYYYYSSYYKIGRNFDEIRVFTTGQGQKKLIKSLFVEKRLNALEKALGIDEGSIPFTEGSINLFTKKDGSIIEDMRTSEDNQDALSLLFESVENVTADPDTRVTATVAGGRKTMGTQMALSFQLYGREQDELIHILAPENKMGVGSEWFFPSEPDSIDERLVVSHIPVLRVGRYITRSLDIPPKQLFDKLQNELVLNSSLKVIEIEKNEFVGDKEILKLPAKLASYLRYIIKRRIYADCKDSCDGCEKCFVTSYELIDLAKTEIMAEHEIISGKWGGNINRTREGIVDLSSISENISRIKSNIRKSKISFNFKERINIRAINLDPSNKKFIWYGVLLGKESIIFKDN